MDDRKGAGIMCRMVLLAACALMLLIGGADALHGVTGRARRATAEPLRSGKSCVVLQGGKSKGQYRLTLGNCDKAVKFEYGKYIRCTSARERRSRSVDSSGCRPAASADA